MAKTKPVDRFQVSETDLGQVPELYSAYQEYCDKRTAFGIALRELKEATAALSEMLGPVLPQQRLAKGKSWTLKEDMETDEDGLIIEVFAESKRRGKEKAKIETERLSLSREAKRPKAA